MSSACQTLTVEEEEMRPHLFVGDVRLVAAEWAADYGRRRLSWNHMIQQTLGADSVQTAQQFGLPAARVVAVIADFTLEFLQRVHQRLSPGLHLNTATGMHDG